MKNITALIYLLSFIFSIILTACEKKLENFEIDSAEKKIVIESFITDSAKLNYVKVSQTSDFYSKEKLQVIKNAKVTLYENGQPVKFSHLNNGLYIKKGFKGKPGERYKLEVSFNGKTYTATDKMPKRDGFGIDSLVSRFIEKAKKDNNYGEFNYAEDYIQEKDSVFKVYMFGKEPQNVTNFYKFDFFRNGVKYRNQNSVFVQNDKGLGSEIKNLEIPGSYIKGDTVKMHMYNITKNAYSYYQGLANVMNNDGGMFNPPPGNPTNNFNNDALGVFVVAPITSKQIIIKD